MKLVTMLERLAVLPLATHHQSHHGTPLARATTGHGTYTFDVVGVEQDDQGNALLRLREVGT